MPAASYRDWEIEFRCGTNACDQVWDVNWSEDQPRSPVEHAIEERTGTVVGRITWRDHLAPRPLHEQLGQSIHGPSLTASQPPTNCVGTLVQRSMEGG